MADNGAPAMPRFRIRTLMIAVGVIALILGSIGPDRRSSRRWTYHRAQVAIYARLEGSARKVHARESLAAADRESVRRAFVRDPSFVDEDPREVDRTVDRTIAHHLVPAEQSLAAARSWAEKWKDCEAAAFWCRDPFAPDVP
jgi:hypothetical protein